MDSIQFLVDFSINSSELSFLLCITIAIWSFISFFICLIVILYNCLFLCSLWNVVILFYSLLKKTDLAPGDFVHVLGDAHVYRTHVRPLQEQLQKQPKPFPVCIVDEIECGLFEVNMIFGISLELFLYHEKCFTPFYIPSHTGFENQSSKEGHRFLCSGRF